MPSERRSEYRVTGPFDASWSGTSGHRTVRVVDFSLKGCFIEDMAVPTDGERVTVTLRLPGGPPIEAAGRVAYVVPPQGFAVVFDEDERLLGNLIAAARRLSQLRG